MGLLTIYYSWDALLMGCLNHWWINCQMYQTCRNPGTNHVPTETICKKKYTVIMVHIMVQWYIFSYFYILKYMCHIYIYNYIYIYNIYIIYIYIWCIFIHNFRVVNPIVTLQFGIPNRSSPVPVSPGLAEDQWTCRRNQGMEDWVTGWSFNALPPSFLGNPRQ